MEVREIAGDELDRLGEITVAAFRGVRGLRLDDGYLAELADVGRRAADALVLVAVEGGAVVGGVTYVGRPGPWASFEGGDEAEIRMLAVAPEAQGKGAGRHLVQACLDQARAEGKRHLVLHTIAAMTVARHLYESVGFRRSPRRDVELDGEMVLLGYELELTG